MHVAPPTAAFGKYRSLLFEELSSRRKRNPVYSLRAFARDLGVSPTALSDVLAQKRRFSKKNALKVAEKLSLRPSDTEQLLRELKHSQGSPKRADEPAGDLAGDDAFSLFSDWYYHAILSLATLKHNRADAAWIAQRLNLDPLDARCALDRLTRMGLLQVSEGRLHRTARRMGADQAAPSAAIRKFHRQGLRMAEQSLERDPSDLRLFTAATIGVNVEKLAEAGEIARAARERIAELLGTGERTEVYTLAIQLFPVSRPAEA